MPNTIRKDGKPTAYGFDCGYLYSEIIGNIGNDNTITVTMSKEHTVYEIQCHHFGFGSIERRQTDINATVADGWQIWREVMVIAKAYFVTLTNNNKGKN